MRYRFLLPALLALSVMGAATQPAGLPPLPTFVYSRGGPIPVVRTPVVLCGGAPPETVIGCYSSTDRRIQIADSLPLRFATFVLYHEEFHVAMRDVGATFDDPTSEDKIANIVAAWRLGDQEWRMAQH